MMPNETLQNSSDSLGKRSAFKYLGMIAFGAIIGGSASFAAVKLRYVELPRSWQIVELERARAVMSNNDNPDCFPEPSIITNLQRVSVRNNAEAILTQMPDEHRAILKNLLRDDGPVPYRGQMAIRSAAILNSLQQLNKCLSTYQDIDCPKADAAHLFDQKVGVLMELKTEAAYKTGIWTMIFKSDLENSSFCSYKTK